MRNPGLIKNQGGLGEINISEEQKEMNLWQTWTPGSQFHFFLLKKRYS